MNHLLTKRRQLYEQMCHYELAKETVDAAYCIHSALGPGLLESVYEVVLAYELRNRGLGAVRQRWWRLCT